MHCTLNFKTSEGKNIFDTAVDMAEHVEKFVDGRLSNQLYDTDFLIQDNTNRKLNFAKNITQIQLLEIDTERIDIWN